MKGKKSVIVIGSGMGGLSAAAMLAHSGFSVKILEQNWMPGGCSSTYWRKNFWFETGATTLVGTDPGMPLHFLMKKTSIFIDYEPLKTPMQVHFDGKIITRFTNLQDWILHCSEIFGQAEQQSKFWQKCFAIAKEVWQVSTQQLTFPPQNFSDIAKMALNFRWSQVKLLPFAFKTIQDLLKAYNLDTNTAFCRFIDEQLLITAQNNAKEVNLLFGATALCYTNFTNSYIRGGLANMVQPIVGYIENKGHEILLRTKVTQIIRNQNKYLVETNKGNFQADLVVAAIPANNLSEIYKPLPEQFIRKILPPEKLVSAFQLGLGIQKESVLVKDCIHHQIHLKQPLPIIKSKSIFLSLSPIWDNTRSEEGTITASVSTHITNPHLINLTVADKTLIENAMIDALAHANLIDPKGILYQHSSGPGSWEKWTGRKYGFVGGYPQYKSIKPWQMLGSRVDGKGLYIVGDSTYPGQGIPGVTLSGLIAWQKILLDHGT